MVKGKGNVPALALFSNIVVTNNVSETVVGKEETNGTDDDKTTPSKDLITIISEEPSLEPSEEPSQEPSEEPSEEPTLEPSEGTQEPTRGPTASKSNQPTHQP